MEDFKILDYINEIIYICKIDTYEMIYANKKLRNIICQNTNNSKDINELKCYEYLHNKTSPCIFCNNKQLKEQKNCSWINNYHIDQSNYLAIDSLVNINGEDYRFEIAIKISNIENNLLKLNYNLELQKRLDSCIRKIVSVGNFEEAINSVLQSTIDYFQAERAYIISLDWEENTCKSTFEQCIPKLKKDTQKLPTVPINFFKLWLDMLEKKSVVMIKDINKLKDNDSTKIEYSVLSRFNIYSLIMVSIIFNGKIQGILTVTNPKKNVNDELFLNTLAFFISNELQKNNLNTALRNLSYHDILTGLNNRNLYDRRLEIINNSSFKSIGVIFLDMNGLKYLNDNLGHKYGDEKLCYFANILKNFFKMDEIFRISGDEFTILSIDTKQDEFIEKCEILKEKLKVDEKGLASLGYVWDDKNTYIEDLIQKAEKLMYEDKEKYYKENNIDFRKDAPKYLSQITNEIMKKEFIVYLQPIYSISEQKIYGAEALVKIKMEDGTIIESNEFIHDLERKKIICDMDFLVFEKVCEFLEKWNRLKYEQFIILINFSKITLSEEKFIDKILGICNKTGVNCNQLVLQITETSNIEMVERIVNIIKKLKERGIRFALDNIGEKYSSLELFKENRLDIWKIDRNIIMRINNNQEIKMIINNIINLCHSKQRECIANGVETEEQIKFLNSVGCKNIQGDFISIPISVDEFEKKYMEYNNKK